jgi:hypothetical protein
VGIKTVNSNKASAAAIILNLSGGEFDLVRHSQTAWRLFSDAIQAGVKKIK